MDWIIGIAAHMAGLSDMQLKQIEQALPATRKLIELVIQAQPLLEEVQPLIAAAQPLIANAVKEWAIVGPVFESVFDTLLQHMNKGNTLQDGLMAIRMAMSEKR